MFGVVYWLGSFVEFLFFNVSFGQECCQNCYGCGVGIDVQFVIGLVVKCVCCCCGDVYVCGDFVFGEFIGNEYQ